MTKKHYITISAEIRAALVSADNDEARNAIECLAYRLALIFEAENPRFEKRKFMVACGVEG